MTIARDLGREIEIATGLTSRDRIVVTPADGVVDGDPVADPTVLARPQEALKAVIRDGTFVIDDLPPGSRHTYQPQQGIRAA